MFELPTHIIIDDKEYPIRNRGDYRMVLDCFVALNDSELDNSYRTITSLIIFYDGATENMNFNEFFGGKDNLEAAIKEMFNFFNCGQPESVQATKNYKLVDWERDSQLIASAVNNVAKYEVRSVEYLHWWTFMGYYSAIGESAFSTIVSIRDKIKRGKKLEKYEQTFKRDNPQYFIWDSRSTQDKEADDYIRSLWNDGD